MLDNHLSEKGDKVAKDKLSLEDFDNMTVEEIVSFLIDKSSVNMFLYFLNKEITDSLKI